jgi:hypothetical protein
MRIHPVAALSLLALSCLAPTVQAQSFLLIPDSMSDTIGQYSALDGSLINANFIVDAGSAATYDFGTPKEAIQVGNEIWISDQIADAIFIFDFNGNYLAKIGQDNLGNPTGALDNIRGLAYNGSTVFVANSGTTNGPGDVIVTIDPVSRSVTGNFQVFNPATGDVSDPFDVAVYNGNLLISDINAGLDGEGVDLVAFDGTWIDKLVSSDGTTGIDFPQQLSPKLSDSNFLAAGFSPPDGLYEYDINGNQINYFAGTAGRGVFELANGNYLYTSGAGTFVLDPATGQIFSVGAGSQYISLFTTTIPEPGSTALLVLGSGLLLGRRRRRA